MRLNKIIITTTTLLLFGCQNNQDADTSKTNPLDSAKKVHLEDTSSIKQNIAEQTTLPQINDTLNELASFISGNSPQESTFFTEFRKKPAYSNFSSQFSKRWINFDSTKLLPIKNFVEGEFSTHGKAINVFYPFSGPDILYCSTLFPDAAHYTMIGLEPVGTLPIIDDKKIIADSIQNYFTKINSSLNAILKFSFFRTVSMKEDLRNDEVDGTIHLLLLFLNKTQHQITSVKPFFIDSTGTRQYLKSTLALSNSAYKNKSVEIIAIDKDKKVKTITYTSTDLSDGALKKNNGLIAYINNLKFETTYLKGASYLMHKGNFGEIRKLILNNTQRIVQDDSGIALQYITKDKNKWDFVFYGEYTKPINMFTQHYQADLDSLYKLKGAKKLGFGLGYNYRDKNSNFMIIKKSTS